MTTEELVFEALRNVIDPEIGVNVVDLGLVYGVEARDGDVHVAMTMTTPACPLHTYLRGMAEVAIRGRVPDAGAVDVELVWDPPWDPSMISDDAKQLLGWA